MDTATAFHPQNPNTSMICDDEEEQNLTPINGPKKHTWHCSQCRNHPKQLCQQLQPVPDTPKSPPLVDQGQRDSFGPDDPLNSSTSAPYYNFPNISAVTDGLQNLT